MDTKSLFDAELILLDLDGTLIDSEEAIVKAIEFSISNYPRSHKIELPVKNLIGQPLIDILSNYLKPEFLLDAVNLYRDFFIWNLKSNVELFNGVEKVLKKLIDNENKLIIVTNRDTATTKKILQELGIDSYFMGIFGSDLGTPKPSDDLVKKAINFAHAKTSTTIFIGDTFIDFQTAQNAGVSFILFDHTGMTRKNIPISVNTISDWCELTTL